MDPRQQQAHFQAQPRQSERQMCSGETHYLWGRGYRLEVIHSEEVPSVKPGWIRMRVPAHYDAAKREESLLGWYRQLLRQRLPVLLKSGNQPSRWHQALSALSG